MSFSLSLSLSSHTHTQTLLEYVKRKKRLTESETRRHMLEMLDGVRFLHTSKVKHRERERERVYYDLIL